MLNQEFIAKMEERLEREKKEYETKIAELERPEKPLDNPDVDDIAQDATDDILEESLLAVHKGMLERIENALGRIANGTYGKCEECNAEIDPEDLEKEPWVEHCRQCKQ